VSSSPTDPGTVVEVSMPQMGVSVAEGTIVEWLKRPGDWVEADETIAIVSTDKIDVEIPAPASGRLARIIVEPDQTVPVGTSLAEIDTAAKPGQAHPEEERPGSSHADKAQPEQAQPEQARPEEARPASQKADDETDRSAFYSPVVRRIAEKHGLDLSRIEGTGIGGRVRKRDVLAYVAANGESEGGEPGRRAPLHIESPYEPEPGPEAEGEAQPRAPAPSGAGAAAGRREPMSPMRRKIAEHMLASRRTSAHCTTIVEVDFSRVAARRRALRDQMEARGVSLTYLAFVAQATVEALERHPILNASIEGEEVVYHDDVNLGIAVALDAGLIVPVIPKAQRLSLEGLAAAIGDLAARARAGSLEPDDVHGGTFTITNPGQFGAILATPIINQPQVAILDLEAVVKRPVAIEDGIGGDAIAIRPVTNLCMSWDHRALDGAEAARFLAEVKERLEGEEGER
jgi:2-oxoglutarate dehydrogenase dihydrolipoamide succinyltransferase (E2 component)